MRSLEHTLNELSRYKDIVLFRTYSSLRSEAQSSYIGYFWWFLDPLLNTILFYTIFAIFLKHQTADYATFLIVGFVFWEWLQSSVLFSMQSIAIKMNLLQQIYLPKFLFPLCSVLTSTCKFLFVLAILVIYLWCRGFPANACYLMLPVVLFLQLLLILSISLPISVLIPIFPDGEVVLQSLFRALMLISGIFFEGAKLPETVRFWFYLNPMAHLIEMYRDILMGQKWPAFSSMGYTLAMSSIFLTGSFFIMRKIDRKLPKILAPK